MAVYVSHQEASLSAVRPEVVSMCVHVAGLGLVRGKFYSIFFFTQHYNDLLSVVFESTSTSGSQTFYLVY